MNTSLKRLLALILAMAMSLSLLSASVWASEASVEASAEASVSAEAGTEEASAPEAEESEAEAEASEAEAEASEAEEDESEAEVTPEEAPEEESEPEVTPEEAPEAESEELTPQVNAPDATWSENQSFTDSTDTSSEKRYLEVTSAATTYPLWVGGEQVNDVSAADTTAHPTWSYAADTQTLTLNGYSYSGEDEGIRYEGSEELKVALSGENTINSTGNTKDGVMSGGSLTISGTGSLSVTSASGIGGIRTTSDSANLTIESGTVYAQGDSSGIRSESGEVIINGGTVTAKGLEGIHSGKGITIEGGTVTAEGTNSGIYAADVVTIGEGMDSLIASGGTQAIIGTVKNALPGTGWTDTAGTSAPEAIDISADGQTIPNTYKRVKFETPHTHDESGVSVTFAEWPSSDSLPTAQGSYYLTGDVELSDSWSVPDGTVNLCLNGHIIRRTGTGSVMEVGSAAVLNLYDCGTEPRSFSVDSSGLAVLKDSGSMTFHGGCVTGGNDTDKAGGVNVSGGSFTQYGGAILGNQGGNGGGVLVKQHGSYTLSGGGVMGNACTGPGGGVQVNNAVFLMDGGGISGNKATWGGGVYGQKSGSITLCGGSILDNSANAGGGVCVDTKATATMSSGGISGNSAKFGGGVDVFKKGSFSMSGGSISDNKASGNGGGVEVYGGTLQLSGASAITDNQVGRKTNNVYLYEGVTIQLSGALKSGAQVGVSMEKPGVFTSSGEGVQAKAYQQRFTSDDEACIVLTEGDELTLHKHEWSYYATSAATSAATITAYCATGGCPDDGAKLTITAPKDLSYDGKAKTASLSEGYSTVAFPGKLSIVYKKDGKAVQEAKEPGKYTASVTVGGATASVKFTIVQEEIGEEEEIGDKEQTAPAAPKVKKVTHTTLTVKTKSGQEYSLDKKKWQKSGKFTGLKANKKYKVYARKAAKTGYKASPASKDTKAKTKKYTDLNAGLHLSEKNGEVELRYGQVSDADSYVVYFRYCGTRSKKPVKTVKGAENTSVTLTKFGGRAISSKKSYTVWVEAKKGKKVLKTSLELHCAGSEKKGETNVRKLSAENLSVRKGKTDKAKVRVTKEKAGLKLHKSSEVPALRYYSSDKAVATVNGKGEIQGVGKGKCMVKVVAMNGVSATFKVTVK